MSLEQAIQDNTAAIKALTIALGAKVTAPAAPQEAASSPAPKAQPAGWSAKAAPSQGEPANTAPDYEKEVKPLVLKLVAKNRATVVALLEEYGVKNAQQIAPEKLAEFRDKIQQALA